MDEETRRERDTGVRLRGRRVIQTNGEGAPTVYANNLLLQSSVWDVTLSFGLLTGATEDTITAQSVVNVILSPQHAKAVSEVLNRQIAHYEASYGPIPSDPHAVVTSDEDETGEE